MGNKNSILVVSIGVVAGISAVYFVDSFIKPKKPIKIQITTPAKPIDAPAKLDTPSNHELCILDLPESILFDILCFLDVKDLCMLQRVNKQWNRIAKDQ